MENGKDVIMTSFPRYIVIDAPGYYGAYAAIYSSHATVDAARRAAGQRKSRIVVSDGGWHSNHQKGMTIHREFAARYTRA
jgi:hypothetical protein